MDCDCGGSSELELLDEGRRFCREEGSLLWFGPLDSVGSLCPFSPGSTWGYERLERSRRRGTGRYEDGLVWTTSSIPSRNYQRTAWLRQESDLRGGFRGAA